MRIRLLVASGALALAGAACAPSYQVNTLVAPDARLEGLRTFRIMPVPRSRDGERAGPYDPMVNNSITNRALRLTIARVLAQRGYVERELTSDFVVAVYASAHERLDLARWDYGYPTRPWDRGLRGPYETVEEYTEGTVVVDVVNPETRDLLWRGSGSARMTGDPSTDTRELAKVAEAVVKRFPRAITPRLALATR